MNLNIVPILQPETRWSCPNCNETAVSHKPNEQKFHNCRGLYFLWCPMVEDGTSCKLEAVDREDYVGQDADGRKHPLEDVQLDGRGRPVAHVNTVRDDGNDVTIYAPCAHAKARID